ncbi:MAG: peroxide stress protein YaaA [Bacteroidota bacterium]|nr:peroxide stress protein YaaA [Bacteroidota bacterium]MDE2833166.1 peroxide stress protein YaaA [Bacteroidota bacterium]MDE2956523.1 peroxide stress protein YaaA [Bacteroidota bacterium]
MSVVLIPSSRSKATGGNPFAPDVFDYRSRTTFNYYHDLIPDRRLLVRRLQELVESQDQEAMAQAFGSADMHSAATLAKGLFKAPLMAARKRFAPGQFYTELDFDALPTGAQRRFLEGSVIVNPLFGVVKPDDMIPNYELSMIGAIPEIGSIAAYWKSRVSSLINEAAGGQFVWDLLPEAYRAVWENDVSYTKRAQVQFLDEYGDPFDDDLGFKGRLVRHLMNQNPKGILALAGTEERFGFALDNDRSVLRGRELSVVLVRR